MSYVAEYALFKGILMKITTWSPQKLLNGSSFSPHFTGKFSFLPLKIYWPQVLEARFRFCNHWRPSASTKTNYRLYWDFPIIHFGSRSQPLSRVPAVLCLGALTIPGDCCLSLFLGGRGVEVLRTMSSTSRIWWMPIRCLPGFSSSDVARPNVNPW